MPLPDDVDDLHLIAEYHTACRSLRRMGWGGVAFGVFNIALGIVLALALHPINLILALIGLLLLGAGIWCLVLPGAEGVIIDGIASIVVGVWNIGITLLELVAGGRTQGWWAAFGVAAIVNGVQCFQKYGRFSNALRYRVSRKELAMMDKLVSGILKAKVKEEEDMIAVQATAFMKQKQWVGRLGQDMAVFVDKVSKEVLVASKKKVRIKPHGKVLLGKSLKASVTIGKQQFEGLISPTSFDRYRDWKLAEDEDDGYAPDELYAAEEEVIEAEVIENEPETGIRNRSRRDEEPQNQIKRRQTRREDGE